MYYINKYATTTFFNHMVFSFKKRSALELMPTPKFSRGFQNRKLNSTHAMATELPTVMKVRPIALPIADGKDPDGKRQ